MPNSTPTPTPASTSTPAGRLSRYFYHASAFGVSGEITRPLQQTIPVHAASVLASSGGHGFHDADKYELGRILSVGPAHTEVAGNFDEQHNTYTTYASSVVENLNVMDVVKADKIVSRITVYCPANAQGKPGAATFSITGSHFENLRIAGHLIDAKLATETFHNRDCSYFFPQSPKSGSTEPQKAQFDYANWLVGSKVRASELEDGDHSCDIVKDIFKRYQQWNQDGQTVNDGAAIWCSPANGLDVSAGLKGSGLKNFGGIICVPRFGIVFLAELLVRKTHWQFNMIRVQMASSGDGSITGGGTMGGGGGGVPPG